jgi:hypothetical protein
MSKTNVNSSVISSVKYENGMLVVYFKSGNTYVFNGVSHSVASGLLAADSKGKYFNSNIMGKYNSIKI